MFISICVMTRFPQFSRFASLKHCQNVTNFQTTIIKARRLFSPLGQKEYHQGKVSRAETFLLAVTRRSKKLQTSVLLLILVSSSPYVYYALHIYCLCRNLLLDLNIERQYWRLLFFMLCDALTWIIEEVSFYSVINQKYVILQWPLGPIIQ